MKRSKVFILWLIILALLVFSGCRLLGSRDPIVDQGSTNPSQEEENITPTVDIETTPSSSYPIMYVKLTQYGSTLNIRESPSTSSAILGSLMHGTAVEVLSVEDEWTKIQYENLTGFVSNAYLVVVEPPNIPSPEAAIPSQPIVSGAVNIKIYKEDRVLELWQGGQIKGEYRIGLGFSPMGHKEKEGDGKTPEGSYYVCLKNPNSSFYLSLGVSYPGISDAKNGLDAGRISQSQYNDIHARISAGTTPPWNTPLGGQIMIHGNGSSSDWTAGCIAVDNDVMDILWEHCKVGTKIDIYA